MSEEDEIRAFSLPPPTYEEALQHRRVEHTNYGGTQHVITNVLGDQHQVELPKPGETESTNRVAKIIMPPMHIYMAGTILGLNCIFPGSGTLTASVALYCCTKKGEWTCSQRVHSSILCVVIGLLQIILTPVFLFGWIWSIFWGLGFVGASKHDYHGIKDEEDYMTGPIQVISPPAYSGPGEVQTVSLPPPYSGPVTAPPNQSFPSASLSSSVNSSDNTAHDFSNNDTNTDSHLTVEILAQVHNIEEANDTQRYQDEVNRNEARSVEIIPRAESQRSAHNSREYSGLSSHSSVHTFYGDTTYEATTFTDIG